MPRITWPPALLLASLGGVSLSLPGRNLTGPLPPLSERESGFVAELQADVQALASLGPHHVGQPELLEQAALHIERQLAATGREPTRQEYKARGVPVRNISLDLPGRTRPQEILVIGAHYDSETDTPGADDNASGVAGMLALARRLLAPQERTLRFVAFVNEEEPWFWGPEMGSVVAANASRAANEQIVGMISLECIGYFSDAPRSQSYPFPLSLFYPNRGDFVAFVSATEHAGFMQKVGGRFRVHASLPSEGAALPMSLPGVGWSDHWSYWKAGYPAVMLTNTAPFRNHNYHRPTDTADSLDYRRMARVVSAMEWVLTDLANGK